MIDSDDFLGAEGDDTTVEIGLTPLIDVVFQLLVFFMVTSSFVAPSILLNLPQIQAAATEDTSAAILVEIDEAGTIHIDGAAVTHETIHAAIAAAAKTKKQPSVSLRADETTPYMVVSKTMEAVGEAGISTIHFIFEPKN